MLNPRLITDAIVAALAGIEALAAAMTADDGNGNTVVRILAFHYQVGLDSQLASAVYNMPTPSLLVAWDGSGPGQADGQTLWKHRFAVYFRMGTAVGQVAPVGYEDLWWLICNGLPAGSPVNIRYMNLLDELEIMDTPGAVHMVDEEQYDRFKGMFVIPEIGDN